MESSESAEIVLSMDDLLCKILAGLPLASLRLFKSVCKRWFSLITDPTFDALCTRTPNADHPKGLLFQLQSSSSVLVYVPFQFKQLDAPPPTRLIRFAYATNSQRYMAVWQSCNSLLLNVVYWRGAIHWLSHLHVYHFSLDDADFIHVQDHTALYGGARDRLVVSRDCLLIARMLGPLRMNVYEMNENGDYRSGWSVKYHVNLAPTPPAADANFRVVSVVLGEREEDSFLVLKMEVTGTGSMLLRYDFVSDTLHQLYDLTRIQLREVQFCSFFFAPSLVAAVLVRFKLLLSLCLYVFGFKNVLELLHKISSF
ncbi:putative F-box-like domain superfamily protein [Helianthus annuus]|nr:putative F-box-like domain superfamily protein [Helianthus annuus]